MTRARRARRPRRTAIMALAAGCALVLLAGVLWEQHARRAAWRTGPPQGRAVSLEGRRQHLDCRGAGSPTVLLESGLDGYGALAWAPVHDAIANITRTCAYARAGMPWSDPARGGTNAGTIARDLHSLLTAAGEHGPYVLVAHSLGALYALTFRAAFRDEVAGMVLVDPTHPDQLDSLVDLAPPLATPLPASLRVLAALHWSGVPRAVLASAPPPAANQAAVARRVAPFAPLALAAAAREAAVVRATARTAREGCGAPDVPLVVLHAEQSVNDDVLAAIGLEAEQGADVTALMERLHARAARCTATGRLERVSAAGHYVQFDRPDRVVQAAANVVRAVRRRSAR